MRDLCSDMIVGLIQNALNVSIIPSPPRRSPLPHPVPFLPPQVQLAGIIIGVVVSIVVLCNFTKCVYIAAAILYTIGFIADAVNTIFW